MAATTLSLKEIQSHPFSNGEDDKWESWALMTSSLLHSLNWTGWLDNAKTHPDVLTQSSLSANAELASSNMYLLLSQRTNGKALSIVKLNADRCGFEVWRLLHLEYLPTGAEPHHAMLEAIIQPKWWSNQQRRDRVFTDIPYDLASLIGQYSQQSNESVSDSIKCATILGYGPRDIIVHLRGAQ